MAMQCDWQVAAKCQTVTTRSCDVDVQFHLNRACAGKQFCSVYVGRSTFATDSCSAHFDEFLVVSYACLARMSFTVVCRRNLHWPDRQVFFLLIIVWRVEPIAKQSFPSPCECQSPCAAHIFVVYRTCLLYTLPSSISVLSIKFAINYHLIYWNNYILPLFISKLIIQLNCSLLEHMWFLFW